MVDFATLKKNSSSMFDKLTQEVTKLNNVEYGGDDRFWYPDVDKAGNGYAVIRFLPAPGDEDVPFVRIWTHGFKGPTGQWYIENSLTTIGKPDPVGDMNSKLWNMSTDDDSPSRKQARNQKRKLGFVSNVYVVQDSLNPENNGKVFLFRYGKKIFDKINEAMNPQFADEAKMNPFDLWDGANFKVKIRNVEGYRNYDKSEFGERGPLSDDDKALENIWKQCHSLQEFLKPENFKSYDELKLKLDKVLGLDQVTVTENNRIRSAQTPAEDQLPWSEPKTHNQRQQTQTAVNVSDDDDDMEFFKKLASKD
jgi:hypothetical protein